MAKSPNGPYSHPNGKIGNIVHYMLKGQCISRIVGPASKRRSTKQKANQQAMSVLMDALRPALGFINVGFDLAARDTVWNPHNLAVSYNKKHAVTGEYPNLKVDYSKLRFSTGTAPLANQLRVEKEGTGIRISWNPESEPGDRSYMDDTVMLLVLYPEKNKAQYLLNTAQRRTGNCFFELDQSGGKQVEVYICFKSPDGKAISETGYVGNLTGTEKEIEDTTQQTNATDVQAHFKSVEATYLKRIAKNGGRKPKNKAFRALEKQYKVWQQRLKDFPGHPSGVA